jgi:hypothetical protein
MKKVLAWAVVLALVLSSFTMAFADQAKTSKDFKDASEINYTEAVDVMVATGIINGYPDGTFGPAKTVKRSEMAKMIACIMNGGEDVGDQYKSACPFADSQGHWAAGYIAYCASEHIIDGRSADVFDPEAEVTGTEVAKMALTSLGYDSKIQGYTGENWAANVLKDAKKNDLFKGLDKSFVPGDPCNRESAAQILFNMLKAAEVEYDTNMSIETGDTSITVNSKAQQIENPNDGNDGKLNLYEDVFDGKLVLDAEDADESGRPAHSWTFDGDDVGTYADSASYEFTVEDAESIEAAVAAYDEDLAEELADYDFEVVVNGGEGEIALGDKVELFVEDESVLAVVTQYLPARIESVDTDVSDEDAEDGITAYIEFADKSAIGEADSDMPGYDESTYVEGAVIAVCIGEDGIMDSYVMEEAAKGEVTKVSRDGKITIDGTAYETTGDSYVAFDKDVAAEKDTVFVLYDYNGYVLASTVEEEAADAETFYGILTAYKSEEGEWSDDDWTLNFRIYTTEGEFEAYKVSADLLEEDLPFFAPNTLVAYTLNDDGEIDSIEPASENSGFEKEYKAGGTLNGYEVSEEVAVFDIVDAEGELKDKADWAVLGIDDLEAAEGEIVAYAAFEEDGAYVAILLEEPLAEEEEENEIVFGFLSGYEAYTTADGEFADVTVWVEGKEATCTTAEGIYEEIGADLDEFAADELLMVTMNGDGELIEIVPVEEFDEAEAPLDAFENDAAIYVPGEDVDVEAIDGYLPVSAVAKTTLTFGDEYIDKQNVSKAVVYFFDGEKLAVSSIGKIKPANDAAVKIYQVDAESGVWNIVVFVNDYEAAPAEEALTIEWDFVDFYGDLTYEGTLITPDNFDTLPATAEVGDVISFTFVAPGGYEPVVTVNDVAIAGDNDVFSFEVAGDTSVKIDTRYVE